jgi:single-strand DNA-binding protein
MANDTIITVVGNLTADPELRFTQSGVAVAGFTIASTPRTFNRQTSQWEDGEALFLRSSVWRDQAEHVAESLHKGDRVIAQGKLKQRSFQDKDGNNRTSIELDVEEVGPSLLRAKAQVQRVQSQGGGQSRGFSSPPQAAPPQQAPANDWGQVAQPGQGFDQPPF